MELYGVVGKALKQRCGLGRVLCVVASSTAEILMRLHL